MIKYQEQAVVRAQHADPTTGRSFPLGATLVPGGVNFSLFSRSAAAIDLLFFHRADDARPSVSYRSIQSRTVRTTTGMCSFPGCKRVKSMDFGPMVHSSQIGVSGSTHPSYCSTHMASRLSSPGTIAAKQRARKVTTPRRP
jgi:hypothetical protein